uniref:Protein aurora borealis n=1 Tax=Hyaloperonospora arabidopsidis (strain Emoy2) TaxID=559515 RepID=M4B7Z5_HYAAE
MTDASEGDELVPCSSISNPFDALITDRNPFPSFDVALANERSIDGEEEEEEDGTETQDAQCALNWSIDTLAELKPVVFSPLFQQKQATSRLETSLGTSGFFEDEKQYEVLRTPLLAARIPRRAVDEHEKRMRGTPTPSRSLPMEPYQCCGGTTRSQERQRQERKKLSIAGALTSESESLLVGPPRWSASPVAIRCVTPGSTPYEAVLPSPLTNTLVAATPKQRSRLRLSFGLSPITFSVSEQSHGNKIEDSEDESEVDTSGSGAPREGNALSLGWAEGE